MLARKVRRFPELRPVSPNWSLVSPVVRYTRLCHFLIGFSHFSLSQVGESGKCDRKKDAGR